jgi:maltose/maltodextrin transport system substrate-binding protein
MGTRVFWKSAPFKPGSYPQAKMPYAEAVKRGYDFIVNDRLCTSILEKGEPDFSVYHSCYPSKMYSAIIKAMVRYATFSQEHSDKALKIAKKAANWLISVSEKAGSPLEYWPPTYLGENAAAKSNKGRIMLIYPAEVALSYIELYKVTKDQKFLDAAKKIAGTYLKYQGEDGSWPLVLKTDDGSSPYKNRLCPISGAMPMLYSLYKETNDNVYLVAADKAFAYLEKGPLETWNWEGQFEDVTPLSPYNNLTKHNACSSAIYLLERFPKNKAKLDLAREILRFAEDQFVCWERPFVGIESTPYFGDNKEGTATWVLPGVLEQYYWYVPIDASAAKLIRTYLALYRAEGNKLDLAKARALGDSITRQLNLEDNRILTHWYYDEPLKHQWINCHIASVMALQELEAFQGE